MKRRALFGQLAAIAAAVAVAPVAKAEAAPETWDEGALRQARAEGYERGRAVESARQESKAMLTDEEMPERTPFGGWVYRTPDPNGHSIAVKMDGKTRYIRYWI